MADSKRRTGTARSSSESRIVPAFTTQSLQKNTKVSPPPKKIAVRSKRQRTHTTFRKLYERGDFPIGLKHDSQGKKIAWRVEIETVDLDHLLPLFIDGLKELKHPYEFLARQGVHDMLNCASSSGGGGDKILATVPKLIQPLKEALNTRDRQVMCTTLKVIVHLVNSCDLVGEQLVRYYRQLLPILNEFKNNNSNTGDGIDYSQRKRENLGDLIEETLNTLERTGGKNSYINIKYMVPTYESCVFN